MDPLKDRIDVTLFALDFDDAMHQCDEFYRNTGKLPISMVMLNIGHTAARAIGDSGASLNTNFGNVILGYARKPAANSTEGM